MKISISNLARGAGRGAAALALAGVVYGAGPASMAFAQSSTATEIAANTTAAGVLHTGSSSHSSSSSSSHSSSSKALFQLGPEFASDLNNGVISDNLRMVFSQNNREIGPDARIVTKHAGKTWSIVAGNGQTKFTIKADRRVLEVYSHRGSSNK